MAVNPFADIFGLEEEEDEEEALRLAEEDQAAVSTNPFDSIFSGEAPEEEPVAEPAPEPAPSAFERPEDRTDLSATGGHAPDSGLLSDLFKRVPKSAVSTAASAGEAVAIQDIQYRRGAAERKDVAGALGMGSSILQDPFTGIMAERMFDEQEQEQILEEAKGMGVQDVVSHPAFAAATEIKDWAKSRFPTDPQYDDMFVAKVAEGAGSLIPFVASSVFGPALTAALGSGLNSSAQFEDAIRNGATFEEALKAANIGAVVGLTEAVPVEFAFSRLNKATGGWFSKAVTDRIQSKLGKLGAEGLAGAATEAIQETFTEFANNWTAKDLVGYDEERELLAGTGEAGGVGGVLGFIMNTGMAAMGMKKQARAENRALADMVPDLSADLALQEATVAMDPARAEMYVPVVEAAPEVTELPPIDFDTARRSTRAQEVGVTGNVTLSEGPILEKVKDKAAAAHEAAGHSLEEAYPTSAALRQQVAVPTETAPVDTTVVEGEPFGLQEPPARPREDIIRRAAVDETADDEVTAAAEPTARKEHVVETDYESGSYTFSTDQGTLSAVESSDGKTIDVGSINVAEAAQGQGRGTALYKKLFETAARKGQEVRSASSITDAAYNTWRSLERVGYKVDFNPTRKLVRDDNGNIQHETADNGPVATIRPETTAAKPAAPAAPVQVKVGKQRLYRGFYNTPVGEVEIGDLGAHFTPNRDVAKSKTGETGETGEYDVDIKKPLRVPREPENGAWHDPARVQEVLEEAGVTLRDTTKLAIRRAKQGFSTVANPDPDSPQAQALAQIRGDLRNQGYDAVVYDNEYEGGGDSVILLNPQQATQAAKTEQQDDGIEVEELTQEQLDAELAKAKKPARPKVDKTNVAKKKITKKKVVKQKKLTEKQRIKQMRAEARAKDKAKGEKIVKKQKVKPVDVAEGLHRIDETKRLSGKPPGPPKGPLTGAERQSMRELSSKEIAVDSILSAMSSISGRSGVDIEDTAKVTVEKTKNGFVVRSATGSDLSLTSQDVKAMRFADLGSFRAAGLANYLRLKIDTMGVRFRGQEYNPHFRRTKTSKLVIDLSTEVIRTINSARVGVQTKLEILNTQWEAKYGQQVQDAPREQLEQINAYLTGNLSLDQLENAVELTPEIVRNLKSLREDIDILSKTMIAEGMIDNELAFQIGKNIGSYLRVQYALKDVEARLDDPDSLLKLIPKEKHNRVMNALMNAYLEPAFQGELHKLNRGTLKRLAQTYGLLANKVVGSATRVTEEGTEVPAKESRVITGTSIDIDRAKISTIAVALQQKLAEQPLLPQDVMLRFLQGQIGGAQASMHGREKSAERARTLSRTDEQLRDEGYTEAEIELNAAFRNMLAEHLDPVTTIQQTVNTMLNHVASHRIVNAITQLAPTGAVSIGQSNDSTGATVRLAESGDKWADVRVIDPDTGQSVPASEVYVRKEIRLQFDRMVRPNFADGLLTSVYRQAQAITKINLTALNAGSHFRNIRSSLEIAAMRGYILNPNAKRTMKALHAASSMAAHDIGVVDQKWTEEALDGAAQYLTKLGILHDSVRTGPIKDLLQRMASSKDLPATLGEDNTYLTASGRTLESSLHKFGKSRGMRKARQKLVDTPLGAYRLEDEGPKILAFIQEREMVADMLNRPDLVEVMRGKRRPTPAERAEIRKLDLKAAKKIRNLFPTYSSVPEFVKDLSANLFATPFPSFNAEMIRNWGHDIRDIADMAAYVTKDAQGGYYDGMNKTKVALRLTERLVAWSAMGAYYGAMLSSIGFAMGWMMSLPFGATPDDEDEITKKARELTEKMAESGYVPGKSELDVYDPFFRALLPGWGKSNLYRIVDFTPGKSMTVMDMSYTMPYSQLTQLSVNLGGAMGAIIEGDTEEAGRAAASGIMKFVGEWSAQEPLMDAVLQLATGESEFGELEGWERTDALLNMLVPGSQTWKSLERLVAPSDDPHAQSVADFVVGQRPFELFFEKSYVNALWPEKLRARDASVRIRDMIRDAAEGEVSEEEFRRRYQNYEEERIQAMAQVEFINHSSDILGFTKTQRRRAIATSTITGDNRITKTDLLTGKWQSTYLTPADVYKPNQKMNSKLTREYRRWIKVMREVQRENDWR